MNFRAAHQHSFWYWLVALVLIVAGMLISHYFHEKHIWIEGRYRAYQALDLTSPNPREPKHTTLVLIGDDEYWTGPLARRVPVRRDYLASLVKALDKCEPSVIAFDFDLRSPVLDGSLAEHPEYGGETALFVAAVLDVSKRRPVVLPAMIGHEHPKELFSIQSSVYGELPFAKGKLQRGYINLPFDVRQIPTPQPLSTGGSLDSFAVSIVRARHENVLGVVKESHVLPFGTFIQKPFPVASAKEVLAGNCDYISAKIAIVGAGWSRSALGAGGPVDLHLTPLGMMTGVLIHANYVEALIDTNTRKPLPSTAGLIVEFIVLVGFAVLLAIKTKLIYQKVFLVLLACLVLIFVSYVAWQNLGYYFDVFLPVIFLVIHAFVDYFIELQKDSLALSRLVH